MLINLLKFHYLFIFTDAEPDDDIIAGKLPNFTKSTKTCSVKSFQRKEGNNLIN